MLKELTTTLPDNRSGMHTPSTEVEVRTGISGAEGYALMRGFGFDLVSALMLLYESFFFSAWLYC